MSQVPKLSPNARKELRNFVLEDLEKAIDDTKHEITNLRIAVSHAKAEKKRRALRFFWELWSELSLKVDNIEVEASS